VTVVVEQIPTAAAGRRSAGLGLALTSAASFGLAGPLAAGLMNAGWSAAAAVTVRIGLAATVLLVPAVFALRGRWMLLVRRLPVVIGYGVVAVAGCQLAYFNAVRHMDVAMALLIEYLSPVVVVLWWWCRGHRPGALTVAGGVVALAGLVLVLNLLGGVHPSLVGVGWALLATLGSATYFLLSDVTSEGEESLPPIVLAASGLLTGAVVLLVAGGTGVLDFRASSRAVEFGELRVGFWVPLVLLGLVAAAIAYVTGIEATRRLGARLASFVALFEVLFALVFAWLLLDQVPLMIQFAGAVLVLGGVVLVKLAEN
jgi:drug/metabolite transporter (DMT)-like permease